MSKKFWATTSVINGVLAIVGYVAYVQIAVRYDELMDKYWENNRQIALYDNENKILKKKLKKAVNNDK